MSPSYGYLTKLFLESEFQHKGNKQMKKQVLSKILQFSWQEQILKITLFKYYTEKDKKLFWQNSSLGQEPTFKGSKRGSFD